MLRQWRGTIVLSGVLATVGAGSIQAQQLDYDQTFAFGDSLSDVGSRFAQSGGRTNAFAPTTSPNGALYNTAFPVSLQDPTQGTATGRFSNGDIHIDALAGELTPVVGTFDPEQGAQSVPGTPIAAPVSTNPELTLDPQAAGADGFGFAHGGAQSGLQDGNGQNVGFLSQVGAFATLQQGGALTADSDDVAVVWVGGNDFFDAAQAGTLSAGTVETAVTNTAIGLNTLAGSGVENFIVYKLPDLSQVPLAEELAAAGDAPELLPALSQLSTAFNAQLQTTVAGQLRDQGAKVTVIDTAALFADIARQPDAYGLRDGSTHCFSLVTQAPTGDCQTPEQVAQTTFLDSLHPTAAGHDIVAQFTRGTIHTFDTATSALGTIPQIAMLGLDGHNNAIAARLHAVRSGVRGLDFMSGGAAVDTEADRPGDQRLSAFVFSNYNSGDRDPQNGVAGFDYGQTLVTVGADYTLNDTVLLGAAVGYSDNDSDLDGGLGDVDMQSFLVSLYSSAQLGHAYGDFTTSIAFDDIEATRSTLGPLGDAEGDTSAVTLSLAFTGGYNVQVDNFTFGPTFGLRYLESEVEEFDERGAGALNLEVSDLDGKMAIGSFGAQASARFGFGEGNQVVPQLGLTYEHDFADDIFGVNARLPGGQDVSGRVGAGQDDAAVLDAGVTLALTNGISANVGGRVAFGRDGDDRSVRGRLRYSF